MQYDLDNMESVSSFITFEGLETEDYHEVSLKFNMEGSNFAFTAELTYYNQVNLI